jgi:hypothetical protein
MGTFDREYAVDQIVTGALGQSREVSQHPGTKKTTTERQMTMIAQRERIRIVAAHKRASGFGSFHAESYNTFRKTVARRYHLST